MDEVVKSAFEKISGYDIFNNFLPGIVFCYLVERTTRITIANGSVLENLFVYYFVGLIISRVGSVLIESVLRNIKIKSKTQKSKEPLLKKTAYSRYEEASEKKPKIIVLSEKNNIYRTVTALLCMLLAVKLYDSFLYELILTYEKVGNIVLFIVVCVSLIILFLVSYVKQTKYVVDSVENYFKFEKKDS